KNSLQKLQDLLQKLEELEPKLQIILKEEDIANKVQNIKRETNRQFVFSELVRLKYLPPDYSAIITDPRSFPFVDVPISNKEEKYESKQLNPIIRLKAHTNSDRNIDDKIIQLVKAFNETFQE